ncbi:MAG: hypothetical protein EBU82_07420 [Flavobacteriia bacterium]|nr:hypothetical protein [Flavobacteriia bacterium]
MNRNFYIAQNKPNIMIKNYYLRNFAALIFVAISFLATGQCVAPTPTSSGITITCGQTGTLTASGGTTYNWYFDQAGTQLAGT